MKHFATALLAATLGLAQPVSAQDNPVVVELYTSQGCSSCPPADKILHELADRDDVIALALHVDYWDYIGWKDKFADPSHAERQRAYARQGQRRSIYTPEMIVQGESDIVGAKPMKLSEAIAMHARRAPTVALELARSGDTVTVRAKMLAGADGPMTVHMLRYTPMQTTMIKRGENAGKTLKYANVVADWEVLGQWDGASPLAINAPAAGDLPTVVIIQSGKAGPIQAAARLR